MSERREAWQDGSAVFCLELCSPPYDKRSLAWRAAVAMSNDSQACQKKVWTSLSVYRLAVASITPLPTGTKTL